MSLSVQLGTSSQSEGATCSASRWRNRTRPVPEILPPMGLTSNSGMRPLPFKLEPKVGSCDTSSFSSSFSPSTWCFWSWWTLCAACSLSLLSALPSDYLTVLSVVAWRSSVQWQCKVSCHGAYCSLWWSWCADVHTAIECVPRNRIAQSQGHSWTALVNARFQVTAGSHSHPPVSETCSCHMALAKLGVAHLFPTFSCSGLFIPHYYYVFNSCSRIDITLNLPFEPFKCLGV